jgi:hypothetical protein
MRRLAVLVVLAACGPSAAELARRQAQDFRCRDRFAIYTAKNHMAGSELGVRMDCADAGPRIHRWKKDKQGTTVDDTRSITPGEFDSVWREIEGAGWQNLKNCGNGTDEKHDPVYEFEVKDDQAEAKFKCRSQSMPYPYNTIVDPLDVAAQKAGKQLGDDEPAELKALEKKPKK